MRYAVIMAGGSGKRLWPLSRQHHPKQLLKLVDGKSLMEIAVQRLEGVFEPEQIFVVTNAEYADDVAALLPEIPRENIIGEPVGRDTANAVALAAEVLAGKDEDATMAVFTADHIIRPAKCFAKAAQIAIETAESTPDALVTFGIMPSWPHTGLGYIECDQQIAQDVRNVVSFKEKPDHTTARQYVESKKYFWNSGMFVWKLDTIRKAIQAHLPDTAQKLAPIAEAVRNGQDYTAILAEAYSSLEKISIDYAIMEKADKVMMVELKCEWIDLGSWPAMEEVVDLDDQGNAIIADNHVIMDSFRNILVTKDDGHLLAIMGLDDCIVIHSPDATLVCKKSDDQRLKELVAAVEKHYGKRFL
ncbi:MAG: NTP transferase domain-containing protein [Phycisphaerae bacterium]|nr:NTP transferase domain-containing protein [Phycisphaerae bacterium]